MNLIGLIGEILAQKINLSPPAGRGIIKLAIKDQFGPFKPLEQIDYKDLQIMISNSLKQRLKKLNIDDLDNLINTLLDDLNKNQSLLTMSKI